jgi:hypothetical protein
MTDGMEHLVRRELARGTKVLRENLQSVQTNPILFHLGSNPRLCFWKMANNYTRYDTAFTYIQLTSVVTVTRASFGL